jgi:protein TonB
VGDDFPAFDTPPELVKTVEPEYPKYAKAHHIGGTVTLRVVVKTDGTVGEVTVVSSSDAMFHAAAIDAARQFRFKPARLNGKAVRSVVAVPIQFR